jgi:hypothetical protein
MKNLTIAFLILVNIATAYGLWEKELKIRALESNKTTNREREVYGEACVKLLRGIGEEQGREGEFFLGRSWKKHGQLVFEVVGPRDETFEKNGIPLCVYDTQSNLMYQHYGDGRKPWLFY